MEPRVKNNATFARRTLFLALATCLTLTACDTGDEYTEAGQLVEKTDADPASLAPKTVTRRLQPSIARVKSLFSDAVARVGDGVEWLRSFREPKDQSPFEWRGLRGGMSFAKLDRLSSPGAPWKCTPFMLSAVAVERGIALESKKFSAGQVSAFVDTVGQRVLDIRYNVSWMKPTDPQQRELEREMTLLAAKGDKMPGRIRQFTTPKQGPHFAEWETPDSSWAARIYYYGDLHGVDRPDGFEIEEIEWGRRIETEIPDSIKGQLHNPESDYYRRPNVSCAALLQAH